jgi:hypothetical protein
MTAPLPGTHPQLLFDAAIEILKVDENGEGVNGVNPGEYLDEPVVVFFGTIVPTDCEHTHVDPIAITCQPWN